MKTARKVNFYFATAVLVFALASGGCATMAPKAEKYVPPPLGSTFTYSLSRTGSYGSGTMEPTMKITERTWEGRRVLAFASPNVTILVNADGSWPAWLAPDGKPILTWDPPIGYDFPLEVGKTWTKSYRVTIHAAQRTMPVDGTWKVESYEDLKIPAGTFKVFKVRYSDTMGNENTQWYYPAFGCFVKESRERTGKCPIGPGTSESELISHTITK